MYAQTQSISGEQKCLPLSLFQNIVSKPLDKAFALRYSKRTKWLKIFRRAVYEKQRSELRTAPGEILALDQYGFNTSGKINQTKKV